jgi:hypothetical protein
MLKARIEQLANILSIFKPTELKIKIVQFLLTFIVIIILIVLIKDILIGTVVGVFGAILLGCLLYNILLLYSERERVDDAYGLLRPGDESIPYRVLRFWDYLAGYGDNRVLDRATIRPELDRNNNVDDVVSSSLGGVDVESVGLGDRAIGASSSRRNEPL